MLGIGKNTTLHPRPWQGIEAMVTRRNPYTNGDEALWPEQAIGLADTIRIFTINGSRAMQKEKVSGSIEAGKYADFIVLDRNLFAIPVTDISETQVLRTVFEGKVVHTLF